MDSKENNIPRGEREPGNSRIERRSSIPGDLPDSQKDREEMRTQEEFIDLPDVKDIPGQEFVNAPPVGALGDTTIASDDEEGVGVFDLDDSEDFTPGTEGDVSRGEKQALEQIDYLPTRDENNLIEARMDNTDFQNEPLNERSFGEVRTASDLDVPGSENDDANERIGEEDEENNDYSLGSADNDNITEGTP
ncbi:hypothetical protein [Flavisolibacter ginsengisoli]|jgi:hypothetical protein|uniref:Uncharacterized protein n=1 Tax=Flavisolibacter ginsengisoli DSM 18119 TaxID=1121884 RepID=A0A1M5D938_9BACT|nr:hypothetical protein [Flavisolibacter ginsengisoli]SHF63400.1 hypothetical protein SAMN02745131_03159 [Flavisolibacter ginsengisoli DSM 18119]